MRLVDAARGRVCLAAQSTVVVFALATADAVSTVCTVLTGPDAVAKSAVLSVAMNTTGTHVYAIYDNKMVVGWDIESKTVVGSRTLKKKPAALVVSEVTKPDGATVTVVVIADKFGDLIALPAPALDKEALLGGHTASVVTDLAVSADGRLLLSADRDEKFRISAFPAIETIESYALGHRSVVSSVTTLLIAGALYVVSSGWDHQVLLWRYQPGALRPVAAFSCTAPAAPAPEEVAEEAEPAATEPAVAAGAVEAGAEGDEDEGEGAPYEKQFVESDAGHYPFKVVACTVSARPLIAAIFRDECMVKLLTVCGNELVECGHLDTLHPPADVLFHGEALLVLGPHDQEAGAGADQEASVLRIFELRLPEGAERCIVAEVTAQLWPAAVRTQVAAAGGLDFSQKRVAEAMGFEGDSGMRKHALDRPFNHEEHIDLSSKKGAKRSKKRKVEA